MVKKVSMSPEDFFRQNEALGTGLPYDEDTSVLGESLTVGGKTIPNRLACQAMEGCDGTADGAPGELTARRYDRFARGGAGLIRSREFPCSFCLHPPQSGCTMRPSRHPF